MNYRVGWLAIGLLLVSSVSQADEQAGAPLRLNQIQVVGTHNSYHLRPPAAMLKAAIAVRKDAKEWDYSRQMLDKQLDQGVRSFELDMHASDKGWRVMHVPSFDAGTTVPAFGDALRVVAAWSAAHPRHVPISFLLELKEEGFQLSRAYRRPTLADLEELDREIREVFAPARLLTPDDVRGKHATLWEAVQAGAWPTLSDAAGKVFLILHEQGKNRAAYLEGHPSLEGRAMFVESDLAQPHSAVLIRNNPAEAEISELARKGYLIRTRVDSQGHTGAADRTKGLASGAHILTTDYPAGEIESERAFALPEHAPARSNPVTGQGHALESLIREPIE